MFFRAWRERRREKIAQAWIAEQMRLPPAPVPELDIDPVALEHWRQAQAARDPMAPLNLDGEDIETRVRALMEWQARVAPWLRENLQSHHDSIRFLEGQRIRTVHQLYAMQSLLDAFVCTHPRPDLLQRGWNQQVPRLIDEVSEVPDDLSDEQKAEALAWQGVVKHYTRLIEQAAEHFKKYRGQDDD